MYSLYFKSYACFIAYKRYKSMIETKKYRQLKEQINNANEKEKKLLYIDS